MTAGSKNLGDNFLLKQYILGQIFPSKSHRTKKKILFICGSLELRSFPRYDIDLLIFFYLLRKTLK